MLLIIEDKDNPAEPLAQETGDSTELVYIPAVTVPVENDTRYAVLRSAVARMTYERRGEPRDDSPPDAGKLLPLYLNALGRTGRRPDYLSPSVADPFGLCAAEHRQQFYARG